MVRCLYNFTQIIQLVEEDQDTEIIDLSKEVSQVESWNSEEEESTEPAVSSSRSGGRGQGKGKSSGKESGAKTNGEREGSHDARVKQQTRDKQVVRTSVDNSLAKEREGMAKQVVSPFSKLSA